MGITIYLLIMLFMSTLALIIAIIAKNKLLVIIFGLIDFFIMAFMLFLVFILIPAM